MSRTSAGKLALALVLSAGILIIRGFSFPAITVSLYAFGMALFRGPAAVAAVAVSFCCMALTGFGYPIGSAFLVSGASIAILFSVSSISRYLFSLSAAAVLLTGTIEGILPLVAAALAASPVRNTKWRSLVLVGGFSAVLLIFGLPQAGTESFLTSQEIIGENGVVWPETAELNLAMRELLLESPGNEAEGITLQISSGGVRDSNYVGTVTSGEVTIPIYPGETKVFLEQPEFPVSILMSRKWKPFSHPVIHVHFAEVSQ